METLAAQSGVTLPLGYSQVFFAPSTVLRNEAARNALRTFVEVSTQGWEAAKRDPASAISAVMESRRTLGYPEEVKGVIDENSTEFQRLSLIRCLPYVHGTDGSLTHHIDPLEWQKASSAMADLGFISKTVPASQSLDATVCAQQNNAAESKAAAHVCEIPDGLSLARKIRSNVAKRSSAFLARSGRQVSVALMIMILGEHVAFAHSHL